jgi:hypothetical protein
MHKNPLDGSDEISLNSQQTCDFFGGVSPMWLWRHEVESRRERERRVQAGLPAEPGPGEPPLFPLPRYDHGRKRHNLGALRRYRDSLPQSAPPVDLRARRAAAKTEQAEA